MILENLKKDTIKYISSKMSNELVKFPLFMYFCRDINKRASFIEDYFRYYLPEWSKEEMVFSDVDSDCVISLVDPQAFEFKFKGLNAHRMKKYEFSSSVFLYRENLETVCDILLPYTKEARVMTIYAGPDETFDMIEETVDEAIRYADENNMTLVFDSFSRRYIYDMERKGFSVAYQKQFMNTQFVETVMSYNM